MGLFRRREIGHSADQPALEGEDVRRYRFILRTAPSDVQQRVNEEALHGLHPDDRRAILAVLQRHAAVGDRANPDDLPALARAITKSEDREPGVLLRNAAPELVRSLAGGAISSSASSGLDAGYAEWDGADPEPKHEDEWKDTAYGKRFDAAMKQRRKDSWGQTGQQL
jgi:hypothetical protein